VSAWLSMSVIAGAQVLSQLICVAGAIWQERARARSACLQIEAAASSGTILCEHHPNGSTRLIVPGTAAREQALAVELLPGIFGEKPRR